MSEPFTIRIFVPDGDPEGIKLIDRLNWAGLGIWFPRNMWNKARVRQELNGIGIYILVGYRTDETETPLVYVGQADGVRNRIDLHAKQKAFWEAGIAFISPHGMLNRAHVTWLEFALISRAKQIARCELENDVNPREPVLGESEKADMRSFLREILRILPMVGIRSFEEPKRLAGGEVPSNPSPDPEPVEHPDTLIVPARPDGFQRTFLEQDCWFAVRIAGGMIDRIRYIAAYQTAPVSAITHYAPIERIETYGDSGKYKLIFSQSAKPLHTPVSKGRSAAIQGPRYARLEKLLNASILDELQ